MIPPLLPAAPTTRHATLLRGLLAAYAVAATADLVALLAGSSAGHTAVKPVLLLLLAAHAALSGGPRLLTAALLCGWGGDVLLLVDHDLAFLAGMGSFAVGHFCYLALFARYGRPGRDPRTRNGRAVLGAAYALALVGTVTVLWPDLPAGLRVPVALYSVLLTVMAFRAGLLGPVTGLGGALFLLSDTLIATGIADWPQLPRPDFWVMLTYLTAQFLLATGVLAAATAHRGGDPAYREERI
ncbi:lysoplasmalogenase family protein [Streptomyces sp. NPDC005955]|uniref:lysoplasmalogenase n=1 Tax=Streptomyces sp. NPDC005955 TaxID=3364738 RepID=UPI0036BBE045